MIPQRRQLALIILLVAVTVGFKDCPSSTDLDRAAKASNELAHDVLLANRIVADVYKAKDQQLVAKEDSALTPEARAIVVASRKSLLAAKDRIAEKLGVIGDKGDKFNDALIALDAKYPQGTPPPQDIQFIKDNLSELRKLYGDVLADLLPFKAQKAVSELNKDLTTIEKAVKQ